MPTAFLPERGVVRITGDDARSFLDGLVTCAMDMVAVERAGFGALLTPQGKILVDGLIAEADGEMGGGFYWDAPRALASDLVRRLSLYRLRAKVTVEDLSDTLGVVAMWGEDRADDGIGLLYRDPRHAGLGDRVIRERDGAGALATASSEAYHAHRVALGIPEGGRDFAYGDAFPHEAIMDLIGGVAFDKGCYVGQEVVSRMQHRGTARTRIVPIRFPDGVSPPEGTEILADGKAAGRTGSVAPGGLALALLRLDRAAEAMAAGATLEAGGLRFVPAESDLVAFPPAGPQD